MIQLSPKRMEATARRKNVYSSCLQVKTFVGSSSRKKGVCGDMGGWVQSAVTRQRTTSRVLFSRESAAVVRFFEKTCRGIPVSSL